MMCPAPMGRKSSMSGHVDVVEDEQPPVVRVVIAKCREHRTYGIVGGKRGKAHALGEVGDVVRTMAGCSEEIQQTRLYSCWYRCAYSIAK